MQVTEPTPITRNLEIDALQEILRWPDADPRAAVILASQLMGERRDREGFEYFQELAAARPDHPLLASLEGLFQARLARLQPPDQVLAWLGDAIEKLDRGVRQAPGLTTYFRGLVLAELPAELGRVDAAVRDLEWVLANGRGFPPGLSRGVNRALARAYGLLGRDEDAKEALRRSGSQSLGGDDPVFVTDSWMTASEGFHFTSPRLLEVAPNVHVAQGYDFGDFAFVVTGDGVVAIDSGTIPANVEAALAALRAITSEPVRKVILTHAHWDHVGGLEALLGPGVEVIAQANFPSELERVIGSPAPWDALFFGTRAPRTHRVTPDRLVAGREVMRVGGVELVLHPVYGGETSDGLLVHVPASAVVFTGDVMMPYLGSPFLAEGSAEGLFDALGLIRDLEPRVLVHGHTGLTENFTIGALPGIEAALRDLHQHVLNGIAAGRTLVEILHDNHLPGVLRDHPSAAVPFLVMRDNFVKRVHHQRAGYWKVDGEGIEDFGRDEWAAALDLVADGSPEPFARAAESLLRRGDPGLALGIIDLALSRHPASEPLAALRVQALTRLRERHQSLNPFKFIVYSGWAKAELSPAP
jgi:glyoxylase-like metal-dependent hydrolase (beta-lactamase superfamily II)